MPPVVIPAGDVAALLPIAIVASAALAVLLLDLVFGKWRGTRVLAALVAIAATLAAAVFAARGYGPVALIWNGAFITGGFTVVMETIVALAAAFSIALSIGTVRRESSAAIVALLLWSACGAMLMAGAANLMTIFLGLEVLSLALYCLCALGIRKSAGESALKYLILSSMASGFLLFGAALFFGATGSVSLSALQALSVGAQPLALVASGLFLVGLAFKLSLVPFHVWTPDVYEGAPLTVTAFMSVVTKAGTLAVLARFAYFALPPHIAAIVLPPLWILAALSMLAGNLAALPQTDLKRLLAYSGIAQLGYIVTAFAGQTALGLRYAVFYLGGYALMNLGAFAVVALLSSESREGSQLSDFHGLAYRRPWAAAMMTLFLLALAGFPPTVGFTGKLLILAGTVRAGYAWLAAILVVGTAISIYVYLKIVAAMFARPAPTAARPPQPLFARGVLPWAGIVLCALGVLVFGLYPLAPSNILPLLTAR